MSNNLENTVIVAIENKEEYNNIKKRHPNAELVVFATGDNLQDDSGIGIIVGVKLEQKDLTEKDTASLHIVSSTAHNKKLSSAFQQVNEGTLNKMKGTGILETWVEKQLEDKIEPYINQKEQKELFDILVSLKKASPKNEKSMMPYFQRKINERNEIVSNIERSIQGFLLVCNDNSIPNKDKEIFLTRHMDKIKDNLDVLKDMRNSDAVNQCCKALDALVLLKDRESGKMQLKHKETHTGEHTISGPRK